MKTIMIIGAGTLQVPFIKICKECNYRVIATDMNNNAEGFKYADVSLNIDGTNKEMILNAAIKYNIEGIVTTGEITLRTVAHVCEKMNLPGISMKVAEVSNNKYLLRECMKNNNIYVPDYWIVHNKNELKDKIDYIDFPCVIKPVDTSGSLGVIKIYNDNELMKVFDEVISNSRIKEVIIEEYLAGNEYSVESLSQNGKHHIIAITEKNVVGYPYFVEERHVIPASLNKNQENDMKKLTYNLLNTIGLDNSAAHTEIKLTDRGMVIIETGARIGGDYITSDLVPLSTGISMHKNIAKIAVGEKIEIEKSINEFSGIQFITPENYDSIISYKNNYKSNDFIRFKEFKKVSLNKNQQLKNSNDRYGYYICVGSTREKLIEKLDFYKK